MSLVSSYQQAHVSNAQQQQTPSLRQALFASINRQQAQPTRQTQSHMSDNQPTSRTSNQV